MKISRISFFDRYKQFFGNRPQKVPQNSHYEANKRNIMLAAGAGVAGVAILGAGIIAKGKGTSKLAKEIIVTGAERVKQLVSKFGHDDFDASKVFKINMHIHSTFSDGKLTPLEILQQAKECAQKLPQGEKFVFSLTDHDSIDGVKIIINEIKRNPKDYANLRFIPGIEMSTSYRNSEIMKGAVDIDYLIYGFNIEDKKLLAEINRRKESLLSSTRALIDEVNKTAGKNILTLEMLQNSNKSHLRHVCSNGYINSLRDYLSENIKLQNLNIDELLVRHFGHSSQPVNANILTTEATKLSKSIGAFSSLAHPGKINFTHADLQVEGTAATNNIISSVLENGGDAIECHYMSYSSKPGKDYLGWWQKIRDAYKPLNLQYSRTGGYDTHGKSIKKK